ncbi:MAG: insulinase family protein, partial [bacterium]|nr:insulinase family protein [bacterium]
QEPVTEEELAKAKVQKVSGSIFYNQSIDDLAGDVAGNEMSTGNPLFTAYYVDEIQKVTTEQIRRVAKKYLHRDNLTVVAVRPKASAEATGEKADAGETTREVRKLTLDNGLTLLLKRNPALPLVSMQAYGKAGVRLETETTNGYTRFMTKMLLKGTGKRTADEIAAAAERLGGSIDSSSGNNSFSVEVDVLSRDLEEGVEIISDVILNAAFPEEEIGKVREELLAEIKRRDDDWRLEADAFFRQVFFIDHPYRLLPGGTEEAVAAAGRDDLISFYRRYVVPDNMVLAVFGDIDVEKTETLLDKYFAGMARSELKLPPVKAAPFSEQARQLFKKNEKEQCSITIGYPGCTVHDEDRYALLVADSVLSGIVYPHGWFHEALRGKENLVYYVHATNWLGLEPGSFHVLTQTPPDKVERVVTLLRREYERIKEELVSDDELENAKNNCITMDRLGKQTNSAQAGGAALNELYGLGFDFSEKMPEKVRAVTAEDVRRVARKYFKGEVLAVVGPSVPESLVPTKKK